MAHSKDPVEPQWDTRPTTEGQASSRHAQTARRAIHLADEAATAALGHRLAPLAAPGVVFALDGDLGAGKTTLARGFVRALTGPDEEVPSPTFTLVQTYDTAPCPIWHFDLYRITDPLELIELGWEEALETGVCLVEWPERLGTAWPEDALRIMLDQVDKGRTALLEGAAHVWGERLKHV